jgi:hypothetical protein
MAATTNESVLGKPYFGLRSTSSLVTSNNINVPNAADAQSAPIAPEDVPNIVDILLQCPKGQYALRVFQQHAEGLCWQDSFYIMLYNQDWFKPFLKQSIEFYMEQFFAHGYTDLTYPVKKEVEEINWSKYNYSKPVNNAPKIKVMKKFLETKIVDIAKKFQERFGFGLPLAFWEYYCLQLHRYILLGYLFLKFPDAASNASRESKSTALFRRRQSIGHYNYSKLALNYKEYVFNMLDIGMYCTNFQKARTWFISFVSIISKNTIGFRQFSDKTIPASNILAYYFGIQSTVSYNKHIVSLFKCQDTWYLYDIDIGTIEFTPEETAKLNSSKIKTLVFENKQPEEIFEYLFTLEDSTTITRSLPLKKSSPLKYEVIQDDFSMILVQLPAPAPAAPAAKPNSDGGAASGGRRKTRKYRYSKRKQTRNSKHK